MASIVQVTPEMEKGWATAIDALKPKVEELNKLLPEFRQMIMERKLLLSKTGFDSMPDQYNEDFLEWMFGASNTAANAASNFMDTIGEPYKRFDLDAYEEDERSKDPSFYVTTKYRRIILGGFGSVWLDMPLTGKLRGVMIAKWTRIAFESIEGNKWAIHFDPTADGLEKFDDPKADEYVQLYTTGGAKVDLAM